MKCFGDKNKTFHCKVILLDEQELIQEVQESTTGQELLDVVFKHLNLLETSYFGLRHIDPSNQTHWLDPNKRLAKQLKGTSPFTLYFSVKFYAADPTKLVEEITRYQFFLQVKQDILQGRLPVSSELAAELGSLAVQSELGDYDPRRHSPGYVSEFRFLTNQTGQMETKIADLHKKLLSYVPSKAELCYLEKVKWLDMYGVDLHPVLGEDSTEYFLGLTPAGIIVLRNKAKVGNYFWPRITKLYFKAKFFMLRVKDKNNVENTYGFETPSKGACKHLWQCCVEHHAFFRLTQAAGNNPQAMFKLGSKFRYSGRTEKEMMNDIKENGRPPSEFARTPSRRYQRRIIEGNKDTPRSDEPDSKPETRTVVSLPGSVTSGSHVYRSTSMTLAPRSDSPRSIRSAPYPAGLQRQSQFIHGQATRRDGGCPLMTGESPRNTKSVSSGRSPEAIDRLTRRTSSLESRSSADSRSCSRSCSRHRRSRCRSSDGESEASSKCSSSSKSHRRHHRHRRRHRHHSNDSNDHKHRHRKHKHRSSERPQMVESSDQWTKAQNGITPSKSNTATVRDLTSGYLPSGHDDTEADTSFNNHSSRRKHRKHRSADSKQKNYPEELRRHIEYNLQNSEGMTEAELKEIPYTKVEVPKNLKVKYTSPQVKRHKSPKRSKSNSSDQKNLESGHSFPKPIMNGSVPHDSNSVQNKNLLNKKHSVDNYVRTEDSKGNINDPTPNGLIRPCPRSNQDISNQVILTEYVRQDEHSPRSPHLLDSTPRRSTQEVGILQKNLKRISRTLSPPAVGPKPTVIPKTIESNGIPNGNLKSHINSHTTSNQGEHIYRASNYVTNNYNNTSENFQSLSRRQNRQSDDVSLQHHRDSSLSQELSFGSLRDQEEEELDGRIEDSNGGGFMSQCPTLLKNATMERGSHFTAVLKPQPSPQSSVTSGISVGSSSVSISTDSSLRRNSKSFHHQSSLHNEFPASSQSRDVTPSSTPNSEQQSYYDKHETKGDKAFSFSEPFYMNANNPNTVYHRSTNKNNSLNEALTQHSTNILIQYHDGNSSRSSPCQKAPTPTPRSSIISTYHCKDASTHIVQSYGPAYANSNIINSLKSKYLPGIGRPSSCLDSYSYDAIKSTSLSLYNAYENENNKFFSLPRTTLTKPKTKCTSSQTKHETLTETGHINDSITCSSNTQFSQPYGEEKTSETIPYNFTRPVEISSPLKTSSRNQSTHGNNKCNTNNNKTVHELRQGINSNYSPANSHWKVYNWDTDRNKDAWCNAGSRGNHHQDSYGQQQSDNGQFTRRGSAGSLDLILGPLIQSALEHQQR